MTLLRAATSRALDAAFPASCPGCGAEGAPICAACLPALDARSGQPPGVLIGMPADLPAPLLQLEWCAPFTGVVRDALHALKYKGERRIARPLGAAVAKRWARAGAGGDLIVPVPVHANRAKSRGYDQAQLIAEVAARDLRLPCARLLERHVETTAQFELDRQHRATNVQGAFRLAEGFRRRGGRGAQDPVAELSPLAGRWIVLVDDVLTTGATLSACASVLMAAGAVGVSAVTVARER